jgi:hypothetical protein
MSNLFLEVFLPKYASDKTKVQCQNQIKRIFSITLEESALSITEIADFLNIEGFDINRKTVERDIEDISLNHPISENDSNPRRFFLMGNLSLTLNFFLMRIKSRETPST